MTTQITKIANAINVKLITGDKEIKAHIKNKIVRVGKKLDADIQLAAMSVAAHIEKHGNVTLADHLYDNMPKGSRRLALAEWFKMFAKVDIVSTEEKKSDKFKNRTFKYNKGKQTKLEAGQAKPWYECKKEPDAAEAFDFEAQLARLLGRAKKAQEDGKEIKGGDLLARIQAAQSEAQVANTQEPTPEPVVAPVPAPAEEPSTTPSDESDAESSCRELEAEILEMTQDVTFTNELFDLLTQASQGLATWAQTLDKLAELQLRIIDAQQ